MPLCHVELQQSNEKGDFWKRCFFLGLSLIKVENSIYRGATSMRVLGNINMLSPLLPVIITPHPHAVFVFIIETVWRDVFSDQVNLQSDEADGVRYRVGEEAICRIYQTARTLLSPLRCCRPFLEGFLISVKLPSWFIDLISVVALLSISWSFGKKRAGSFWGSPPLMPTFFLNLRGGPTLGVFKWKL